MSLVSSPSLFYREMNLKWFPANLVRGCIKTFDSKRTKPLCIGVQRNFIVLSEEEDLFVDFHEFSLKVSHLSEFKTLLWTWEISWRHWLSVIFTWKNVSPTWSRSRCSTDTIRIVVNSKVHTIDILLQPGLLQCTAFNAVHWVYNSPAFTWKSGISVRHTILFNVWIFQDYFKVQSQKNWTAR